jgi:hypothetical protein
VPIPLEEKVINSAFLLRATAATPQLRALQPGSAHSSFGTKYRGRRSKGGDPPPRARNPKKEVVSGRARRWAQQLCVDIGVGGGGCGRWEEVKGHAWFRQVDWGAMEQKRVVPPIVPTVRSSMDAGNFNL